MSEPVAQTESAPAQAAQAPEQGNAGEATVPMPAPAAEGVGKKQEAATGEPEKEEKPTTCQTVLYIIPMFLTVIVVILWFLVWFLHESKVVQFYDKSTKVLRIDTTSYNWSQSHLDSIPKDVKEILIEGSGNFQYTTEYTFAGFEELEKIEIAGTKQFANTRQVIFSDLPALTVLKISCDNCLTKATQLVVEELPALKQLVVKSAAGMAYPNVNLVHVGSCPELETIEIGGADTLRGQEDEATKNTVSDTELPKLASVTLAGIDGRPVLGNVRVIKGYMQQYISFSGRVASYLLEKGHFQDSLEIEDLTEPTPEPTL